MTPNELADQFRTECDKLADLVAAKNQNYAGADNPAFQNFELVEALTNNRISREAGTLVRMCDKMSRLWALLDGNGDVVGESFGDTCADLAGYALLLKVMYQDGHAWLNTDNGVLGRGPVVDPLMNQSTPSAWQQLTGALRGK